MLIKYWPKMPKKCPKMQKKSFFLPYLPYYVSHYHKILHVWTWPQHVSVWEISLALDTPIFHNSILNFFNILPFSLKYRFPIRDQKFYFFGHLALFGFAMVKPSGTVAQNLAFFLPQMPEKGQKKCFSCQILRLANIDSWGNFLFWCNEAIYTPPCPRWEGRGG